MGRVPEKLGSVREKMKNEKNVQVVHALPGRVRLKLPRLRNNTAYAAEIQRDLLKVSGIKHLESNPRTGSLLIEYDSNVLEVLSLHPSVYSCLGLSHSNVKTPSAKNPSSTKDRTKTLKTARKGTPTNIRKVSAKKVSPKPKVEGKAKPKKSSKKTKGRS